MGAVTVITSGKGGVGKSTVAAGLGAALARRGKRVLLIDADAGLRGLDRMTGADENMVFDAFDIVEGNCAPIQAIYPCPPVAGLYFLPSPADAEHALSKSVMKKLTEILRPYYDHILVDSPAGLGADFHAAVSCAQSALLVVNADPIGLRNTQTVSALLAKDGIVSQKLVINRFQETLFRASECYRDLDEVIDVAGVQLLAVIPDDINLVKAAAKGQACPPGLPGSMAFDRMAARLEGEYVPLSLA